MRTKYTRPGATLLITAAATAMLAGCGPSSTSGGHEVPPARVERIGPSLSVVLTPLGLERVGLQTGDGDRGPETDNRSGGSPAV